MKTFRVVVALALFANILPARAQGYPAHAVAMVVPFSAGGPTDTIARIVSERMSRALGQTVVVENTTGAGGSIAVGKVARAAPDGYTLSIGHIGTHVINGAISPAAVIAKLNGAIVETLADPAARKRLADLGQEIPPREQQSPAVLGAHHKAEIEKWWPVIRSAGIKAD